MDASTKMDASTIVKFIKLRAVGYQILRSFIDFQIDNGVLPGARVYQEDCEDLVANFNTEELTALAVAYLLVH